MPGWEDTPPAGSLTATRSSTLTWGVGLSEWQWCQGWQHPRANQLSAQPVAPGKADDAGYVALRGAILNNAKKAVEGSVS